MANMHNMCFYVLKFLIDFMVLCKQLDETMTLILEFGDEVRIFGKDVFISNVIHTDVYGLLATDKSISSTHKRRLTHTN